LVGSENFEKGDFEKAINLFDSLVTQKDYKEFLTLPAYEMIS